MFSLHHDGRVHVHYLPGEKMASGYTMEKKQTSGVNVLCAMICWETLGLGIRVYVTLTCTTYLNIIANQVHTFMATILFKVLMWPLCSLDLNPAEHLWASADKPSTIHHSTLSEAFWIPYLSG